MNWLLSSTEAILVVSFCGSSKKERNFRDSFGANRSVGQITIIAQAASYFSILLLSTNRFFCIFKPLEYLHIFNNRNTFVYISITVMICLAYGCVYFHGPCYFIFARSSLEFTFSQNTCGDFLSHYIDFWMSIVILAIAIFLDFFTLVKLRMY
ncbi:hypothetical protein DICVIV_13943 [Dictyocaulus viviparus]|uniref:G-protein coupled receptors family 1 profile domain-containing protein n=1 Tax=Dictyocaulus viviparus TaxID=29172 RepID=A0A0D8X6G0_DICVI|nr:hypothetical protein DICVIV_13943 [Dictyocaulus viviparus]